MAKKIIELKKEIQARYKTAMDSTAPGAIKQADVPSATPNAGTIAPAGKSTEPGPFAYRFSTTNGVREAKEVPGARENCFLLQEGTNKSELLDAAPPGGSNVKDNEPEKYEDRLIGTP